MENVKKNPHNIGFIVLGIGLMVVGLSSDNMGLMAAGIVFIVLGLAFRRRRPDQDKLEDNE